MIFEKEYKKIKNNSEFKKIIISINWLFLSKIIQLLVTFFVSIIVIRYLGPEQYGALSYIVAVVVFFSVFSNLGLDTIAVKKLVVGQISEGVLLGTIFYMKLFGGILAVILIIIFFSHSDNVNILAIVIVSFSLLFQAVDVIDYWFQSRVISKYVAYSRSFAYIVSAILKVYLVSIMAEFVWFAVAIFIESVLVAGGLIVVYLINNKQKCRWIFNKNIAVSLLTESWPLILSSVSVIVYMRIDQFMISNMLGYEELGNYSVAVNLSEAWYFIPIIIISSVFPAIIKAKKCNNRLYYDRLQKIYTILTVIAFVIAVFVTFFSKQIIELLYGLKYIHASVVLAIYIWAGIFIFVDTINNKWIINEGLQKYLLINVSIGAIINIILNYFLINDFGIKGAAFATLISYIFSGYILWAVHKQTRVIFYMLTNVLFFIPIYKKYINNFKNFNNK